LFGSNDGPDTVAANFLQALSEGDTDEADTYLHERYSSVTEYMSQQTLDQFEAIDLTIEETEIVEESDEEATVDVTYSGDGTSDSETERFVLVTNDDDEWVIVTVSDA